jgi:hypothetical protein
MNSRIGFVYVSTLVGLAFFAFCPSQAGAADFGGSWSVSATRHVATNRVAGGLEAASPVCVFRQTGNAVTGSCKGPAAVGPVDGTVSAQSIVWLWHRMAMTWGGVSGTATFTGARGPDGVISGTWSDDVFQGGNGVFTARPTH